MSERKLVGTEEMFKKALAGGYAIGAYNVNNMEILQGIAEAAEETRSPIILQVSAGARKYANQTYLIKLVEAALATTTVPIALHLDHGADFEICIIVSSNDFLFCCLLSIIIINNSISSHINTHVCR